MSGSSGKLEKLEVYKLEGKNSSASSPFMTCGFNPPEYSVSKAVNYSAADASASDETNQQFVDTASDRLELELFFDTSQSEKNVKTEYVSKIDALLEVDDQLHAPPECQFHWGDGLNFRGLVTSADKRFTRFLPSGVPVRARVNITVEQSEAEPKKLESTDKSKAWTVTEGDTLWLIAAQEYGDTAHWRTIAEENGIDNPRNVDPGDELELPPL